MEKIEIIRIAENIYSHKGFSNKGCYESCCTDTCCRRGCDMDKETHDLILRHREAVEGLLGYRLESCFAGGWTGQTDFLGRDCVSTTVVNGTCAFHVASGKGCVLWQMVFRYNAPKRIVPSTCRLYPLTWDNGELHLVDAIERECNCIDPGNTTCANLWETQKEAIEDIFFVRSAFGGGTGHDPAACLPETQKIETGCGNS